MRWRLRSAEPVETTVARAGTQEEAEAIAERLLFANRDSDVVYFAADDASDDRWRVVEHRERPGVPRRVLGRVFDGWLSGGGNLP